jgi:hypothetical protein
MKISMSCGVGKKLHLLLPIIAFALFLSIVVSVSALGTGVKPMDRGIEVISNLFNIQSLQSNEQVQIGFLKFALFIVLFAVSNQSLKRLKVFDKKTAGITAFAFSTIGVFMMPHIWLLATGSTITGIMSSLIFLGFFIGLSYVAVFVLRPKENNPQMGLAKHLLGLILLFLLLTLLDDWALFVGLPVEGIVGGNLLIKFYSAIISWTYLLITILIIVKIISLCAGIGGAGKYRPGPEPPLPPEPPEPPMPPYDFAGDLNELERLLNEYDGLFNESRDACNDILQTHFNHMRSIGGYGPPLPPVSAAQWQRAYDAIQALNDMATRINTLYNQIVNNPDFGRMILLQRQRFNDLITRWTNYLRRTEDYRNDFMARYNNGDPPA